MRTLPIPAPIAARLQRVQNWREERLADPRHSDRVAAVLGSALGICFLLCFITGILSHLIQHPPSWFDWPTRPADLFRFTQGLHVATGIAAVPLLFAKLWAVFPRLFQWPLATNTLHAIERLSLLPLVGGALFMLVTGVANIELWYPWPFFFPAGHYAVSFVVMGALIIHLVAKWGTARAALRRGTTKQEIAVSPAARRRFLAAVGATSAGLVAVTIGQTVSPLRRIGLLAPRHPDIGVQGFPVNKTAIEAGVTAGITKSDYSLVVESKGAALHTFTLTDLHALAMRSADLPIACVEGWSASRKWTGVSVRELLRLAGAPTGTSVGVESLQNYGRYRRSVLTPDQADDADTMLAMFVDDEPLAPDHGFPLRLISPARPGVLQTKWVVKLVAL